MPTETYSDTVLAQSPASYWKLGEAAGSTTFADEMGLVDLGIAIGSPSLDGPCPLIGDEGGSVRFSNTQALSAASTTPFNYLKADPFSFSCWAWFPSSGLTASAYYPIVSNRKNGATEWNGWHFGIIASATAYVLFFTMCPDISSGTVGYLEVVSGGVAIASIAGRWSHFLFSKPASADGTNFAVYHNGVALSRTLATNSLATATNDTATGRALNIGRNPAGTTDYVGRHTSGGTVDLAHCAVFSAALTAQNASDQYAARTAYTLPDTPDRHSNLASLRTSARKPNAKFVWVPDSYNVQTGLGSGASMSAYVPGEFVDQEIVPAVLGQLVSGWQRNATYQASFGQYLPGGEAGLDINADVPLFTPNNPAAATGILNINASEPPDDAATPIAWSSTGIAVADAPSGATTVRVRLRDQGGETGFVTEVHVAAYRGTTMNPPDGSSGTAAMVLLDTNPGAIKVATVTPPSSSATAFAGVYGTSDVQASLTLCLVDTMIYRTDVVGCYFGDFLGAGGHAMYDKASESQGTYPISDADLEENLFSMFPDKSGPLWFFIAVGSNDRAIYGRTATQYGADTDATIARCAQVAEAAGYSDVRFCLIHMHRSLNISRANHVEYEETLRARARTGSRVAMFSLSAVLGDAIPGTWLGTDKIHPTSTGAPEFATLFANAIVGAPDDGTMRKAELLGLLGCCQKG